MSMNPNSHFRPKFLVYLLITAALFYAGAARANGSMLTLSAQLPSAELSGWLNASFPEQFTGDGQQSVCQRLIGVKVCGDARWQYQVQRTGDVTLPELSDAKNGVRVNVPLAVRGNVGVQGDVSRLLGLDAVPISANLILMLDAQITGTNRGCPKLTVNLTPEWQQKPSAVLPGNIKISFTEILEKALADQIQDVQMRINDQLNCDAILAQLKPLWSLCHLDATQEKVGPGVWAIALKTIHWSFQTHNDNDTYALLAGIDTNLTLHMGLTESEVQSRLAIGDCTKIWGQLPLAVSTDPAQNKVRAAGTHVVFDPNMGSTSQQAVKLKITHQAMANYAQAEYSNRNLGTDEGGNELHIKTVDLAPVNNNNATAIALETQFNATVRAGGGVRGFFQKLLGFGEKSLDGVMRIEARPVWDKPNRVLRFEAIQADITELAPSSKLSLTKAAFVLLERQAQKSLAKQSTLELGNAIDGLSNKVNNTLDPIVQKKLNAVGGQWQANSAAVQVNNILALEDGMALDAQLNADWVMRFSSETWPTDFRLSP